MYFLRRVGVLLSLKDNVKSLIATAAGHFVNDGSLNIFPILYPILLFPHYGFTNATVGVIAAILNGFSIVASPFIGRKSDVGRNFVLLIVVGVVTISVGVVGFVLAMTFFSGYTLFLILIPFALITGFGSSFYHPLGAAILNEQWERRNRGRAMGINGSFGSFGILAFPIMTGALYGAFGVSSIASLGALGFGVAALIFFIMRNVEFGQSKMDSSVKVSVPRMLLFSTLFALTLSTCIRYVFAQGTIQFIPIYLNKVNHLPLEYVPLAFAVMPAVGMIAQPTFGQLADRIGRRLIFGISNVGTVVAMFLFIFSPNIYVAELFLAIFALFQFTGFPLILALTVEIAPRGATTLSNSIVWGFGSIGGTAIGPLILGFLSEPAFLGSLPAAFFWITVIGAFAIIPVPFIPRPIRQD